MYINPILVELRAHRRIDDLYRTADRKRRRTLSPAGLLKRRRAGHVDRELTGGSRLQD